MSEEITQNLSGDLRRILARLDSIDSRLDSMDTRLDNMDRRFDSVDLRLDNMDRRFDSMDSRLDNVDQRLEKLEARAYDTKPIWEQALAELVELGKRMDNLDGRFPVLTDDVIQNRADFRKFDQRLPDLEQAPRA